MKSEGRQLAEEKVVNVLKTREHGKNFASSLQKQRSEQQLQVKKGLLSVTDIAISWEQRGIIFRGPCENSAQVDGNFLFFCKLKVTI